MRKKQLLSWVYRKLSLFEKGKTSDIWEGILSNRRCVRTTKNSKYLKQNKIQPFKEEKLKVAFIS